MLVAFSPDVLHQTYLFKARALRQMERHVFGQHSVLRERSMRLGELVHASDAVSLAEFADAGPHGLDDAGDIVAGIVREVFDLGELPVLGVSARNDDLDEYFVRARLGHGRVSHGDDAIGLDDCFLHDVELLVSRVVVWLCSCVVAVRLQFSCFSLVCVMVNDVLMPCYL